MVDSDKACPDKGCRVVGKSVRSHTGEDAKRKIEQAYERLRRDPHRTLRNAEVGDQPATARSKFHREFGGECVNL